MDNYIIRIYRREENDPGNVTGIVEFVETERRESFRSAEELLEILCGPKSKLPSTERNGQG
ncbi:MAG: hypothetical protein JSV26_11985 [bacterium]|nr:MAG: hypothetical protein JSV26_11985 [bacterium]